MKKKQFSYSTMVAAILIIPAVVCSIAWTRPSFSPSEKDKAQQAPAARADAPADMTEEAQLVRLLENDGLINQVKGFVVEKKQNVLIVNGAPLPGNIAGKYISVLKKDEIRVEVYPFMERLRQHPDAGFLQILLPVSFSSPCVDTKPKKPGC